MRGGDTEHPLELKMWPLRCFEKNAVRVLLLTEERLSDGAGRPLLLGAANFVAPKCQNQTIQFRTEDIHSFH
jgi:hypothetical protein